MKSKIFYIICFVVLILLSLFNIFYFMRYDILTEHDLCYVFYRVFLEPEHGRYLATFLGNIFTQRIPEFLNIHINDFQPVGTTSIKAFFVIITCILISNSGFLFNKKNFLNIFNAAFLFVYSLVFLLLFNCFFFYEERYMEIYFNILENTVFFEYPLSILFYVILMSSLVYYGYNKKPPYAQSSFVFDKTTYTVETSDSKYPTYEKTCCYRVNNDIFDYLNTTYENPKKSLWDTRIQDAVKNYEDEGFDIISMNNTLYYIYNKFELDTTVENIYRILKKDAILISDPYYADNDGFNSEDLFKKIGYGIYMKK